MGPIDSEQLFNLKTVLNGIGVQQNKCYQLE